MYPHRWPILILVLIVATIALSSIAYGDTGRGPFLQLGSTNISGNPLTPTTLVGSGGYGLRHLLHSDSLRQTATDQQGIENFSSNTTAYALTNYPLSEIQLAKAGRRLVQVPIAFSPLVVIYNIAGIEDGELRLDGACLNGIYTCDIRYWSDPQIVALNPSLAQRLPRELIRLFAHDDSDSTTRLFRQYVWETSAWSSECVLMRVSDFESAPDIAQNVYDGNYSIGYTEFASALSILRTSKSVTDPSGMAARKNMVRSFGIAAIKNKNGSFVAPSKEMVYPFQAAALPDSIKSPKWGLVNVSASGELGAYPMGGLVYIITDANLGLLGGCVAAAMKEFLLSSLSEQFQANVSEYGGVPLPQSQVMLEKQQIESLSTTPPSPVQPGDTALPLPTLIGAVVGSTLAAAVLIGGSALCYVRYRRRLQVRQVTESIRAWRAELAKEGLLVQHEDIHYECVPGSNTKHVVLGQGSFGKVYKANWNGTTVAVKVLKNKSDSQRAAFVREANMLQSLRYPNIVHYLGCAINDHNEMMLVMECMGGGDLSKAMSKERGGQRRFSWHVNGRYILLGIARGMAYMHSKGVIIFDVKAANVLLDETGMTAKIADVGEAKAMAGSSTETLARGTKVYMAPELFYSSNSSGDGTYKVAVTQAVDVYSFGVLMWEVLTGERPQYASESLRKPRVPEECPLSMDALWKRCIARAPHQRPTANEILAEISAAVIPVR